MKKIYKLSLLLVDKPKFDDRLCDFDVVAESLEEAIAKGEEAFAKGCLINKTTFIKYYEPITEYCECEVEGVFLPDYIE